MGDTFIIAIDFGTAYSGYAYTLSGKDPKLPHWGIKQALDTVKTPTCVLFDENEEFLNFGYDAKSQYTTKGNAFAKKTLLFENFKMDLYGKTRINEKLMITAANGKQMTALKVFTESLRYLKEHALTHIAKNTRGTSPTAFDFTWVLTVPAIWDASSKQFMRKAATEAGIVRESKPDKLVIALEPEAASIWCMQLPTTGYIETNTTNATLHQNPGTKYVVADCGGGTVDITVHEVLDSGVLKELHKASGNDMGGEQVNKMFKCFLQAIFSCELWNEFERKFPIDVQKLMNTFRILKTDDDDDDEDVYMTCPPNLEKLAQQPIEKYFENVQGVSWDEGEITISREKMRSFFDESLRGITKSLKGVFQKVEIDHLVLVGGYAESTVLRKHITKQFGAQCSVLCPAFPQQAILQGAVMFGGNPAVVVSRKSAFTYGIKVFKKFDASKHKADKMYTNDSGVWCDDCFSTLVKIDEDVGWDETRDHIFEPADRNQTAIHFGFYRTERENPQYVDDWGIEKLNSFDVESPDTSRGLDRQIQLQMKFGFTEITATATDVDSKSTNSVKIDFLSK